MQNVAPVTPIQQIVISSPPFQRNVSPLGRWQVPVFAPQPVQVPPELAHALRFDDGCGAMSGDAADAWLTLLNDAIATSAGTMLTAFDRRLRG